MKKTIGIIAILVGVSALGFLIFWPGRLASPQQTVTVSPAVQNLTRLDSSETPTNEDSSDTPEIPEAPDEDQKPETDADPVLSEPDPTIETEPQPQKQGSVTIPSSMALDVPFIVQAPFANWQDPYGEACEEAAVLTVHHFYQGTGSLTQQEMKDDLDPMLDWGLQRFNDRFDTTIVETALFFQDYLNYDAERLQIVEEPTIDDIKAVIAQGYPVIIPAAGQLLGNRYFQTPGPVYHMLVITGYDSDEFITNDPGTRRGENYRYAQSVLYNAIHDWTGNPDTIQAGKKVMLVVLP